MESIVIEWIGGNCPVQAEGRVGSKRFYFRSRHDHWRVDIGDDPHPQPEWSHEEEYDKPDDAGWVPQDEARTLIHRECQRYLAGEPPGGCDPWP